MDVVVDMHCHLGFLRDAARFAAEAQKRGMAFFSNTVTPDEFGRARELLGESPNVRVGVGLHPWWVHDGRCGAEDVARVCELVGETRFVGEVGLDFGKRCAPSREVQVRAFTRVARACAQHGGRLLSVHAVRSADCVLDVLEETGCLADNQVIFHWYSDSNEALWRAVRAGCYFSVNMRMLSTRRGREYARVLPADRLLLETDLPPEDDAAFSLDAWEADVREALSQLESIRGEAIGSQLARTSARLIDLK